MIAELLKYADAAGLTGREPFHKRPVHWLIDLDEDGKTLGLTPATGASVFTKGVLKKEAGKTFSLTRNYYLGSVNQSSWLPDFLSGTAAEIFERGIDELDNASVPQNTQSKREKFKNLLEEAKKALPQNEILNAIFNFLSATKRLADIPYEAECEWLKKKKNGDYVISSNTIAFRVAGKLALNDGELRNWWESKKFLSIREDAKKDNEKNRSAFLPENESADAFHDEAGTLTDKSPCVFGTIPLVSFGNAPFCSYGLGAQTAKLRLDTVEKAAAALNALLQDEHHRFYLGEQTAVFWARNESDNTSVDCDFLNLLQSADTLAVSDFLKSIWGARPKDLDAAAFTLVVLEKGTGRFAVKSVENNTLQNVAAKVAMFFKAIALPDSEQITLSQMAESTIAPKSKTKPAGHVYASLLGAATKGGKLEFNIAAAAIRRQAIEFANGADDKDKGVFAKRAAARVALLKLYFQLNKEKTMNEGNHEKQEHPAYLCGRVLALFDKIHNIAHKRETGSSPAYRYYGAASSTPALVFPRLRKLAAIHLEKIGGGLAHKLQQGVPKEKADPPRESDFDGLNQIIAKFSKDCKWPRTLSLEDQGRFAIGFHYEKARKWPKYLKNANPGGEDDDANAFV
jgi:CRISPR-associated protein Csd1